MRSNVDAKNVYYVDVHVVQLCYGLSNACWQGRVCISVGKCVAQSVLVCK